MRSLEIFGVTSGGHPQYVKNKIYSSSVWFYMTYLPWLSWFHHHQTPWNLLFLLVKPCRTPDFLIETLWNLVEPHETRFKPHVTHCNATQCPYIFSVNPHDSKETCQFLISPSAPTSLGCRVPGKRSSRKAEGGPRKLARVELNQDPNSWGNMTPLYSWVCLKIGPHHRRSQFWRIGAPPSIYIRGVWDEMGWSLGWGWASHLVTFICTSTWIWQCSFNLSLDTSPRAQPIHEVRFF